MSAGEPVGIASLCAVWNQVKFFSSHCALKESCSSFTQLFFSPYVYLELLDIVAFYVAEAKPSLEIL